MARSPGVLYIVATPIGNLDDMTIRAVDVLQKADIILCEDTRTARKLFSRFKIKNRAMSYYAPKEITKSLKYLELIMNGRNAALISEAGTPSISDPGAEIVRRAHENGIKVEAVPGPSAVIAALSVSGMPADRFFFGGFLPRGALEKQRYLTEHLNNAETFVFYESRHRIADTLEVMSRLFSEKEICICRELTKKFETVVRCSCSEAVDFIKDPNQLKGEFVVVC